MMLRKGMLARKQRTAYLKSDRPKYGRPKPMSDEWRKRNAEGDPKAKVELKKHYLEASQASGRQPDAPAAEKKKPENRNRSKTHQYIGVYRFGGAEVSKKALKSQGPKALTDAIKGSMNTKKMRRSASSYDREVLGFESGKGPKRAQTEAFIYGVQSGKTGQSLWTAHKNAARGNR